jgi:hypothetical protein
MGDYTGSGLGGGAGITGPSPPLLVWLLGWLILLIPMIGFVLAAKYS